MSSPTVVVPTSPDANPDAFLNSIPISRRCAAKSTPGTGVLSIGVIARPNKNGTKDSRRRRSLLKPEKLKWRTVARTAAKNLLLLALLLSLGRTAWKWTERIRDGASAPLAALDYEVRVSEVEASVKSVTKMFEEQLEVVEKKIGSVTEGLVKRCGEKSLVFEEELRKLGDRTDSLSESFEELKGMGLLSRREYDSFIDELKNSGALDGGDERVRLDDVRALARDFVEREIEKHAADGLGRVDYAVASAGGRVVRHSEPYNLKKAKSWLAFTKGRNGVHASAQKMLEPSFGEPGQCFPLQGSQGFVEIRLRMGIIPEAVTLEHVSKSVAYDRSSALKDCQIFAWFEGPDDDPSNQSEKMILRTKFSYDLEKSNAQTFNVVASGSDVINMIRLEFSSNHGSLSLTCIYRLRVHGYEPHTFLATIVQP